MITYSIVVPAYNEEQALPVFFQKALPVFDTVGAEYEVIVVNDGSSDRTKSVLADFCARDKRVKAITFSRNFGQQAAFLCGLSYAVGEYVLFMDADLQDPPEVALEMIRKAKEGFDVVHARRRRRRGETLFKRLSAQCFYRSVRRKTGLDLPLDCGDFCLISRKVASAVLSLGEHKRLLRVQTVWVGFSHAVIEFDRPERSTGKTKYTLAKMVDLASDGMLPNVGKPMAFAGVAGAVCLVLAAAGYIALTALSVLGVAYGGVAAWLLPTIVACTGLMLCGQSGQNKYLASIYEEAKDRPKFIVDECYNIEKKENHFER